MATVVYGALKVPVLRIAELYFKTDYINGCRLNICLFKILWLMNLLAIILCAVIQSEMIVSIFCRNLFS